MSTVNTPVPAPFVPVNPESPAGSKIIFLDFDGVILHYRTLMASPYTGHSNAAPDPMLCHLLVRCCELGAQIVVSSTWRDAEESCKAKLAEGGLLKFLHDDWRTDWLRGENRVREIADWLDGHPNVTDYRILDDDDFGWTDAQRAKWYECSPYDGMRAMDMKDLAEWAGVIRTKKPAAAVAKEGL